jgi:hypothetical protein
MRMGMVALLAAGLFSAVAALKAEEKQQRRAIPQEVKDIAGAYSGSWTSFGLDQQRQPVKQASWTDTIQAENPQVEGDRAYVNIHIEMNFEGGQIPPFKLDGKEGYFLKPDGTLGDYFIETFGRLNRGQQISKGIWTYASEAEAQELARMGLNGAKAGHVVVKVMGMEDGVETHRITRITTARWKDAAGKEQTQQFVSLQGVHRKEK